MNAKFPSFLFLWMSLRLLKMLLIIGNLLSKKYGHEIFTFYGKSGHTIDTCYPKNGVPPHLQHNSSSNAQTDYIDNVHPDSSCDP